MNEEEIGTDWECMELFDSETSQRALHSSFVDFTLFLLFSPLKKFFFCIITANNKKCLSVPKATTYH